VELIKPSLQLDLFAFTAAVIIVFRIIFEEKNLCFCIELKAKQIIQFRVNTQRNKHDL
jgi:hypothetical protein